MTGRGDRVVVIEAGLLGAIWPVPSLQAGMTGTVEMTDSQGTVHVRWDNGQRLGARPADGDRIAVLSPPAGPVNVSPAQAALAARAELALAGAGAVPVPANWVRKQLGYPPTAYAIRATAAALNIVAAAGGARRWRWDGDDYYQPGA